MAAAKGVQDHPQMKLGLRPPTPGKPVLRLSKYLTGILPEHPTSVDYIAGIEFGMYSNDQFGVCGPTYVANSRRETTARLLGKMQAPALDDVYDLYRRSGNPHFDPRTGDDDNGVNMQVMLQAVVSGGIGSVKALGFAKIDVSNLEEIKAAIAIFGFVGFGVDLQVAQQAQTQRGMWDYQPSGEWGGHAILGGRYAQNGVSVITWAQVVLMTARFIQRQAQEAWILIWPEHLSDNGFMQGVNLAKFAADYEAMTGKQFPAVVPPSPPPIPTPPSPTPVPGMTIPKTLTARDDTGKTIATYVRQ